MPRLPVIVASENGRAGVQAAMQLLRTGGRALDAVELACRIVEDDPQDHSVGYSGLPNVLGEVELDASIMDGRTLSAGAVAGVQGYGARDLTGAQSDGANTPRVDRGTGRRTAGRGNGRDSRRSADAPKRCIVGANALPNESSRPAKPRTCGWWPAS